MERVVECKTKDHWIYVNDHLNTSRNLSLDNWDEYQEDSCINLVDGKYGNYQYYSENNYQILTFEEWYNEINAIIPEPEPEEPQEPENYSQLIKLLHGCNSL